MSKLKDYLIEISAKRAVDRKLGNRSLGIQRAAASLAAKAGMKESSHEYDEDAVNSQLDRDGVKGKKARKLGRTSKKPSPEVKEESTENLSLQEQYAEYFTRMAKNSKRNSLL